MPCVRTPVARQRQAPGREGWAYGYGSAYGDGRACQNASEGNVAGDPYDYVEWSPALMAAYERVRVVGQGAVGTAWLVRRRADGCLFIAKEVSLEAMGEPDRDAARNEIYVLQQLTHPNVVRYVEHHEDPTRLVIITEYCDGGDLEKLVEQAQTAPLSEDYVFTVFAQLCRALEYLHSQNMLHRDLKAANVFITSGGTIKLGDFGIAKSLQHTGQHAMTLCGTPFYFSPELCNGDPYNQKSDIWALGVLLYQLLSGRKPYEAPNILALVNNILSDPPQPLPNHCSGAARDLVGRLLARDAAQRPAVGAILMHPALTGHPLGDNDSPPASALSGLRTEQSPVPSQERIRTPPTAPAAAEVSQADAARQQWLANRRAAAENKRRCREQQQGILCSDPPLPFAPPPPPPDRARHQARRDDTPAGSGARVAVPVLLERAAVPLPGSSLRQGDHSVADGGGAADAHQLLHHELRPPGYAAEPPPRPSDRGDAADAAAQLAEYQRELRREALRNRQRLQQACLEDAAPQQRPPPQPPPLQPRPLRRGVGDAQRSAEKPDEEAVFASADRLPRSPAQTAPSSPPAPTAQPRDAECAVIATPPRQRTLSSAAAGRGCSTTASVPPVTSPECKQSAPGSSPAAPPAPDTEVSRWLAAAAVTAADGGPAEFAARLCSEGVHTVLDLRKLANCEAEFKRLVPGWGYRRRILDGLGMNDPAAAKPAAPPQVDSERSRDRSRSEERLISTPVHPPPPAAALHETPSSIPAGGSRPEQGGRSGCCVLM
eukprot:TRINITY_DN5528_c0_g1_i1.p1 TRINITY_DN5528_c0_g1~~TRINITY_DN5528_c0_g1_i1.p1  ORF type:complete len:803 (+),score=175.72 TRINITY_DN5528_c0_g1_i1:88-2409(+)